MPFDFMLTVFASNLNSTWLFTFLTKFKGALLDELVISCALKVVAHSIPIPLKIITVNVLIIINTIYVNKPERIVDNYNEAKI
jgi:hypothetical protein